MNEHMENTSYSGKKKQRSSLWLAGLAGIGAFTVAWVVMFFLVMFAAVSGSSSNKGSWKFKFDSDKDDSNRPKVGVVELKEEINDKSVAPVIKNLYKFADEDDIKAIVLRVESPGGSAASSQELYNAIKDVRKKKKVVVSMGTMATSGAFYISCAGDYIFASPATITASIGVIAITTEIKDLLGWMKMKPHIYKTGKYKDMLTPLREPTPDDETMINKLINDIYEQFVSDVLAGRPKVEEAKLRAIADGRVITGRQAKELGLIDEFGGLHDAARYALKLAGVKTDKEPKLVYPEKDAEEFILKLLGEASSKAVESAIKGAKAEGKNGLLLVWPGGSGN